MKVTRVIRRESGCVEQGRPIMIEIHPRVLVLWLKGTRGGRYSISHSGVYWLAAKAEADQKRQQRRRA